MRPTRAVLVIELRITDPAQIPEALTAINPPRIPHLLDTDNNAGQRLRDLARAALGVQPEPDND
jgi:hypothetical protein